MERRCELHKERRSENILEVERRPIHMIWSLDSQVSWPFLVVTLPRDSLIIAFNSQETTRMMQVLKVHRNILHTKKFYAFFYKVIPGFFLSIQYSICSIPFSDE